MGGIALMEQAVNIFFEIFEGLARFWGYVINLIAKRLCRRTGASAVPTFLEERTGVNVLPVFEDSDCSVTYPYILEERPGKRAFPIFEDSDGAILYPYFYEDKG